jgi:prepilin-type N-terminal cleavage/methylation domain-containing protein
MLAKHGGYNFFHRLWVSEDSGFTLIEVLVSLLLVYLMSGLVLNVISVGAASLGSSGHQTLACAYGTSLLEEMKAYPERFIIPGGNYAFNSDEVAFAVSKPEGLTAELEVMPVGNCPEVYRVTICIGDEQGERSWEEWLLGFVRLDPEI